MRKGAAEHGKKSGRFKGVVFDEIEHVRMLWPYAPNRSPMHPNSRLSRRRTRHARGLRQDSRPVYVAGRPATVATHVWPVMEHIAARAGFTVCPKICKETFSPVSSPSPWRRKAVRQRPLGGLRPVVLGHDPGTSPEEMRCNLLMAYWLGADLVYIEGRGVQFACGGQTSDAFRARQHDRLHTYQAYAARRGLRWFCKEYLPANPAPGRSATSSPRLRS